MIKILHIGLSSNKGGIENFVKNLMTCLPDDIKFDFINVENTPLAYEEYFRKKGSVIYQICPRKKNPIRSRRDLERIILSGKYDYVHHHIMSLSWMEPALIASNNNVKAILHSHTNIKGNLNLKYKFLHFIGTQQIKNKKIYRLSCSEQAGKEMFSSADFNIIDNGIDLSKFRFNRSFRNEIRKIHSLSDEEIVIGHVGRVSAAKNYPFLIRSFSQLINEHKNLKLMLIGNIQNDEKIKNLIRQNNIENYVIFVGSTDDMNKYYSAMDLFYFPSLYEGLSVSLIEAQSAGLPCIVSKNVSIENAVTDLVKFVDIDEISDAVLILKSTIDRYLQVDRENVKIPIKYDINFSCNKLCDFYRSHEEE